MFRRFLRPLSFFLLSLAVGALFIPWSSFADPDALYHAKVSSLLWAQGPLQAFPWLDLTLVGQSYADLHFLFHAVVAPFTALFGPLDGLRVAIVLLFAVFVTVFDACLRWLQLRSLPFVLLLLTSPVLLLRLLLGKGSALALIWFVIGLAATGRRRPFVVGIAALGFSLSHGGWPLLPLAIAFFAIGDILYSRVVEEKAWRESIAQTTWREFLAALGCGILGVFLHPNFPQNLRFSWIQFVTIGTGTPFDRVVLGSEWLPPDPGALLVSLSPTLLAILLVLLAALFFPRRDVASVSVSARRLVSVTCVLALVVAMTFASRRHVEYLAPVFILWAACLFELVDVEGMEASVRGLVGRHRLLVAGIVLPFLLVLFRVDGQTFAALREGKRDEALSSSALAAISRAAKPGDRVFHPYWDDFPRLFLADDRLRYVSGMDPTFLLVANPDLSDLLHRIQLNPAKVSAETFREAVRQATGTKFVFLSKRTGNSILQSYLQDESKYRILAEESDGIAAEVLE